MESPEHLHPIPKDFEGTPFTEKMVLAQAIEELIIEKKITSSHEIRHQVDLIDSRSPMLGAELIAHGWLDSKFKEKLLINLNEAAKEIGIDTGTIPIRAIENTEKIHNLIVATKRTTVHNQANKDHLVIIVKTNRISNNNRLRIQVNPRKTQVE